MHLNLETMGDQGSLQALADAPFPLTEVDKWVLSQSDEDYKMHDWDDLRHIIGEWADALYWGLWVVAMRIAPILHLSISTARGLTCG